MYLEAKLQLITVLRYEKNKIKLNKKYIVISTVKFRFKDQFWDCLKVVLLNRVALILNIEYGI